MGWNNHITSRYARDSPPTEWERLVVNIKPLIDKRIIDKVELVSFVAKGHRKARWLLVQTDPEYCSKIEAFKVAKKLISLIFLSRNGGGITQIIEENFPEVDFKREITKCPICKKEIELADFDRNAKKDPIAIQIGHDTPLSKALNQHNNQNIFWIHRKCNFLKGERTTREAMLDFLEIIKNHIL